MDAYRRSARKWEAPKRTTDHGTWLLRAICWFVGCEWFQLSSKKTMCRRCYCVEEKGT